MVETAATSRTILIVGFEGAQSLDIVGPLEVFAMANRLSGHRFYDVSLASCEGAMIVCNSGLRLSGVRNLADVREPLDTILVAGGDRAAIRAACASSLPAWVKARVAATRRIGGVCSGALILAAAGLLDGRRATTHWGFAETLRESHPRIAFELDAIFVADPPFYTSGGVTAGIDLCLALLEADCGADLALAVARNMVLFMRRPGGQAQFSPALGLSSRPTSRLKRLIAEIVADPAAMLTVPDLADRAAMSPRTFSRVFKRETGMSPAAFVEAARIDRAKTFLESSRLNLGQVAEGAGFGSIASLHRVFQKRLSVTPAEYRRRFRRFT